jgi:hypothetical protein
VSTEPQSAPVVPGRPRHRTVSLDFPLTFAGRMWSEIHLRRLTAGEVAAYVEDLRERLKDDPNATSRPPIFVDETGVPIPAGLFEALDDDDAAVLDEAAEDFLPRRFRAMTETRPSSPEAGSDTAPTSSGTSAAAEPS